MRVFFLTCFFLLLLSSYNSIQVDIPQKTISQEIKTHTTEETHSKENREVNNTNIEDLYSPKVFLCKSTGKIQRVFSWEDLKTVLHDCPPKTWSLVLFDASWCPFSFEFRPKIAVVAELYPTIPVFALDIYNDPTLNLQFSLFGFPAAIVFNGTYSRFRFESKDRTLRKLVRFVSNITGQNETTNLPNENEIRTYLEEKRWVSLLQNQEPKNPHTQQEIKENSNTNPSPSNNPDESSEINTSSNEKMSVTIKDIEIEELYSSEQLEQLDYYLYFSSIFLIFYSLYMFVSLVISFKEKQD